MTNFVQILTSEAITLICMNTSLENENERRKFMLYGNEWKVIFTIGLPVVVYNSLNQIFQFFDTLIAANISSSVVSIVSFLAQISLMLNAIVAALSMGGGIVISNYFGSGNMDKVRKYISTIFFLAIFLSITMLIILIPFAKRFLILFNMPEALLTQGTIYFIIQILSLVSTFINSIYLSVQKSLGKTKTYMYNNFIVVIVKTLLNVLFILVLKLDMLFLPVATLLAQSTLTVVAIRSLTSKKNPFQISIRQCQFNKLFLIPLTKISFPIFLEKFVFSFGKVIVNSMSASYGTNVIGALGVSNRLGGLSTNPMNGFQDSETSLVSQNMGNKNLNRAINVFYKTLIINFVFACICFVLTGIFKMDLINLFSKGNSEFSFHINQIYTYIRLDTLFVSINTAVMGLLYGLGKTKITLILNAVRLFCFRIPILFYFMNYTNLGVEAIGIAMLSSNVAVSLSAGGTAYIQIKKIKKSGLR